MGSGTIVKRDDLAARQKLNVTAFPAAGVAGADPGIIGERYEDAAGNLHNPLVVQPVIVPSADGGAVQAIHRRALERKARLSLRIEDMFETGHDAANRAVVKRRSPDAMNVVGLAPREDKKTVDKITNGAKMHA